MHISPSGGALYRILETFGVVDGVGRHKSSVHHIAPTRVSVVLWKNVRLFESEGLITMNLK